MEIPISQELFDKLTAHAVAAGYSDASDFIAALANEPTEDPRGSLDQSAIEASAARLSDADASIDAGHGIDADHAVQQIAKKYNLPLDS